METVLKYEDDCQILNQSQRILPQAPCLAFHWKKKKIVVEDKENKLCRGHTTPKRNKLCAGPGHDPACSFFLYHKYLNDLMPEFAATIYTPTTHILQRIYVKNN